MLKLQLYLSSFLHLVQTISLQHSHIFVQKEVHRTYLEAQISVHISFKVRGQVFVKFHCVKNCTIASLCYGDEHRRQPTQGLLRDLQINGLYFFRFTVFVMQDDSANSKISNILRFLKIKIRSQLFRYARQPYQNFLEPKFYIVINKNTINCPIMIFMQ